MSEQEDPVRKAMREAFGKKAAAEWVGRSFPHTSWLGFQWGFQAGRDYEAEKREGKIEGLEEDLRQLIRVALTNPAGLPGFIQANYPKEYAESAALGITTEGQT